MTSEYIPSTPPEDGGSSGTADTAREQAGQVGHDTAEAARDVAGTAKDEAANVAGTTKEEVGKVAGESRKQAKALFDEAREQLTEQAGVQQERVASGLHSIGDELTRMAESSDQQGIAGDLVSQAATRASDAAAWLDGRDPGSLLTEVRNFARRRPGTFIAVSAVAGLVAGRLVKSLASEAKDEKADAAAAPAPHFTTAGNNVPPSAPPAVGETPLFDQVRPAPEAAYVPPTTDGSRL
jgi:uncharacterized protein YjbJ (UPF0337 family)